MDYHAPELNGTAESPRLLVSWGKRDRALAALHRLRPKVPDAEMRNELEVESMEAAVEEARRLSSQSGWLECVVPKTIQTEVVC